jgi:hypothetical protein
LWCCMKRRIALHLICLAVLVTVLFSAVASAEIAVGVKKGYWIEYHVTATGDVPEGHDITWSKIEVTDVEGKNISVTITSRDSDKIELSENHTLNLETGQIGDSFIIPANLNAGENFTSLEGNITISEVKEKSYAGATRKIVYANTSQTQFYWDRSTGVLVEAYSSYPDPDFAISTKVERTNMWQAQIFGIDPFVFTVPIIATVIAVLAFFMIRKVKD